MRRALFLVAASVPLFGCAATVRRPVQTTEAATAMVQITRSQTNEFDPAISPDGTAIAYDVADSPGADRHVEVMALKDAGQARAPRTYSSKDAVGLEPAWKPDGSGLIFVSGARNSRRLVETIGPSADKIAFLAAAGDPTMAASWPAVSPDGARVAISLGPTVLFQTGWGTDVSLDSALGVTDLVGSGVEILGTGTDPAWSPDGRRVAFTRAIDGHAHVFIANANGSDAQQVTDGADDDTHPSWSPDGGSLVFCSVHAGEDRPKQANLFVVRPDGSWLTQLTEGDRVACRPDWARDGFIYFHANATDHFHIWRIRTRQNPGEAS
jgi:Tol biopolymer transport system component